MNSNTHNTNVLYFSSLVVVIDNIPKIQDFNPHSIYSIVFLFMVALTDYLSQVGLSALENLAGAKLRHVKASSVMAMTRLHLYRFVSISTEKLSFFN